MSAPILERRNWGSGWSQPPSGTKIPNVRNILEVPDLLRGGQNGSQKERCAVWGPRGSLLSFSLHGEEACSCPTLVTWFGVYWGPLGISPPFMAPSETWMLFVSLPSMLALALIFLVPGELFSRLSMCLILNIPFLVSLLFSVDIRANSIKHMQIVCTHMCVGTHRHTHTYTTLRPLP